MNYRKVGCSLVILFCLSGNLSALAQNRLISCPGDRENQKFVCLKDAVDQVRGHLGEKISIVGYGNERQGMALAEDFRYQLINTLRDMRLNVTDSLFTAKDGGSRSEPWIEINAGG